MIEIIYDRRKYRLEVKGHAQTAEKGQDLVCAAASILVYTLAASVDRLSHMSDQLMKEPKMEIKEGYTLIVCRPTRENRAIVGLIFSSVCVGFEILEQQYPDNVKYVVKG
jgi:uncharacterized protein YsxB (DUF464 family)